MSTWEKPLQQTLVDLVVLGWTAVFAGHDTAAVAVYLFHNLKTCNSRVECSFTL